jgi:hypothetical protein
MRTGFRTVAGLALVVGAALGSTAVGIGGGRADAAGVATMVVSATSPGTATPPGQTAGATVSVTDTGTRVAKKTKVTVTLPAVVAGQPTVVFTPAAGVTCKAAKLTPLAPVCVVGAVPAGASTTVGTVVGTPPADTGGGISTAVTFTGPTNAVTVTLTWAASLPTLQTSITLGPPAIELGQSVTGTLTVADSGYGSASTFLTYVPLPSTSDPEQLVSETAGTQCVPYYGILQCWMPGLAPGASITVVFAFQPQAGPSAQVTATADVQGTLVQGSRSGDVATSNTVSVTGTGAALSVTSSNAATVPQGSNWQRTLTVTNTGDTPALDTVVQDWSGWFDYLGTVSGGTCAQFSVGVGGKGGSHPVQAGTQCSIGTVPAGSSVTVTFTLEATPIQAATAYTNKVVVSTTTPLLSDTQGSSTVTVVVPTSPVAPALLVGPGSPSGNVVVGDALTVGNGTWNGTPTITFGYQWQDCDSTGTVCTPIAGATGQTYTVQTSDVGSTIDCVVTAANGGGSVPVATPPTVAAIAAVAPSVVTAPTAAALGEPAVGIAYAAYPGTWGGTPVISFTYQWFDCNSTGAVCSPIAGATGTNYVLTAADVGHWLMVQVTAANSGGSTVADSNLATTLG